MLTDAACARLVMDTCIVASTEQWDTNLYKEGMLSFLHGYGNGRHLERQMN